MISDTDREESQEEDDENTRLRIVCVHYVITILLGNFDQFIFLYNKYYPVFPYIK